MWGKDLFAVTWVPCILRHWSYAGKRPISRHMGPMYIATLVLCWEKTYLQSHGSHVYCDIYPMLGKELFAVTWLLFILRHWSYAWKRLICSPMGPMYIATLVLCWEKSYLQSHGRHVYCDIGPMLGKDLLAGTWVPCILRHWSYAGKRLISRHMGSMYIAALVLCGEKTY